MRNVPTFGKEDIAVEAFKEYRVRTGVVCKKCGHNNHYWLANKQQFQCKACRFRTTLRSGTILEGGKLPYSYFFIAFQLLTQGNDLSIDEFQKQTGHKYYEPLWDFLRKIKSYVKENGNSSGLDNLKDIAERHFGSNFHLSQ
ncbi:MAG: transposase [Cytophagales bacterium]|nr:transposase [Cytophagales bacterium]